MYYLLCSCVRGVEILQSKLTETSNQHIYTGVISPDRSENGL